MDRSFIWTVYRGFILSRELYMDFILSRELSSDAILPYLKNPGPSEHCRHHRWHE